MRLCSLRLAAFAPPQEMGPGGEGLRPAQEKVLAGLVVLLNPHAGRAHAGQHVRPLAGAELALPAKPGAAAVPHLSPNGLEVDGQGAVHQLSVVQRLVGGGQDGRKLRLRLGGVGAVGGEGIAGGGPGVQDLSGPRHITAPSMPKPASTAGMWAIWPNMSGRYPTIITGPNWRATAMPI